MLGIELVTSGMGTARVRMAISKRHLQELGQVHGGIIVTLADTAIGEAVESLLEDGQTSITVEIKINFIAPAHEGELIADSRVIHKGGRLAIADSTVTDGEGTLIATGLSTCRIIRPKSVP